MEEQYEAYQETPGGYQPGYGEADGTELQALSTDSKNMGMICHLLGIVTGFLGPLILWLIKKDDDAFIEDQGREALNFQITVMIVAVGCAISFIGLFLLPVVGICNLIFCIMGCVASSKGEYYRYPLCIRLIK